MGCRRANEEHDRQGGPSAQIGKRALGYQLSAGQDQDAVGARLDLGQDMRGQQDRGAVCRKTVEQVVEIPGETGSRPDVGSSSTRRRGRPIKVWARPTRWRIPLE